MERLLTEEKLKKLTNIDGIIELLCGIPSFNANNYENLSSEQRDLVDYTLSIELITESQIKGNLRRSMDSGNLALINRKMLTALSLLYFGVKDENGKYVKYICPYTGKEYDIHGIGKELSKPYSDRKLDKVLEVEHIMPHSSGGGTVLFNCIPASREANSFSEKGNLHLLDWLTNSKSSGYKYYEKGGQERLIKLVNYILSAYEISFEEYMESDFDFYGNQNIEEQDGVDNDDDLENEIKIEDRKKRIKETNIEGYIPFLNQLIEQLEKEKYDTEDIKTKLKELEEKGIVNNLEKYSNVQKTIEELFKQEDSKSYLTYSLNVDYIKLVKSIITDKPEEIKEILTSRFNIIKQLTESNGKSIKDYFISLRDIQEIDLLYKEQVNENDIESFINNIKLGYDGKIELFIEMLGKEEYTKYEKGFPDKNNIFSQVNRVPFQGYETIEGLDTSHFWGANSDRVKERIENQIEELKNKERKTEEEKDKLKKLQKAEKNIDFYEFTTNIDKRIDCYIEMLSKDEYTKYRKGKLDEKNIFGYNNKVPFQGYETIEGIDTSHFWNANSDRVKERIENQIEELKNKERKTEEENRKLIKFQKVKKAIDVYDFTSQKNVDRRIDCFIEMLSKDEYTNYRKGKPDEKNIFGFYNKVPFQGYETIEEINTSRFWQGNSSKIKERVDAQIEQLYNNTNRTKEESNRLEALQKAKEAINDFEFYLQMDKRIDCYIEMLSKDEYTKYRKGKPDEKNIFGFNNKVPFQGYENIRGLNTSQFFRRNSDKIKEKLREKIRKIRSKKTLTLEEQENIRKLERVEKKIEEFEFYCDINKKLDCYIEMLAKYEYTSYKNGQPDKKNIFGTNNKVPFQGYETIEGLNTSQFWQGNSSKIKERVDTKIEQLYNNTNRTKEESNKLETLQKAKEAINDFEFYSQMDKRIDCYIEMLSKDEYTKYRKGQPDKKNIFGSLNKVPFQGYETIEGLDTSHFWNANSDRVKERIENQIEELKNKERKTEEEKDKLKKLQKAEKNIDFYEFTTNIDKRIDCYIEMLSKDEYTKYRKGKPDEKNIFGFNNKVLFQGYETIEGLDTSHFWNSNSDRVKERIENQIEELKNKERKTEEEQEKLKKLQKAERNIEFYEFTTNIDKKIDCYIKMLSMDEYTKYKNGHPDPNNIFVPKNKIKFYGYEEIDGLNTSYFWGNNLSGIKDRLKNQIEVLKNKDSVSKEEKEKIRQLKKAERAIEEYEFDSILEKRIDCYIEMLSMNEYTRYEKAKPDNNNILVSRNTIPFKGYDTIDGLNTSHFFIDNSQRIKERIESQIGKLKDKDRKTDEEQEKVKDFQKAKKAIDIYEFSIQGSIDKRIECYIEMLGMDEYTRYEKGQPDKSNILASNHKISFKGYEEIEGLNTSNFWSRNKEKIIARLFYNLDEEGNKVQHNYSGPKYDKARKAILEYERVGSIDEYIEKKKNTLFNLRENASNLALSEIEKAGSLIRHILNDERETA